MVIKTSPSSSTPNSSRRRRKKRRRFSLLSSLLLLVVIVIAVNLLIVVYQFYSLSHYYDINNNHITGKTTTSIRHDSIMNDNNTSSYKIAATTFQVEKKSNNDILRTAVVDNENDDMDIDNPIIHILKQAGYNLNDKNVFNNKTMESLPDFDVITKFYGPPIILGLDDTSSCRKFRDGMSDRNKDRVMAVAGMFNSGTNLLTNLLQNNCRRQDGLGKKVIIPWQVPWGKHFPENYRGVHNVSNININNVLPIVTIRDPYTWMQSMCQQNYAAQFDHSKSMCPNIVPYPEDIKQHPRYGSKKYMPVHIKYDRDVKVTHQSLAHIWNEWYNPYVDIYYQNQKQLQQQQQTQHDTTTTTHNDSYPLLIVRMEDIIFHAEEVVSKLCTCALGNDDDDGDNNDNNQQQKQKQQQKAVFKYRAEIANDNPSVDKQGLISGLLRSIIKYGNITNRRIGYPNFQLKAAKDVLDSRLMELFQYPYEELSPI